ncbi:MAG TPA: peptidoglycan DD-metalloendopeptidase family protein [Acidimicrobiales bacterium]|nr:peptidoglycan DD-metalloendopeptidase family protein [Acidimicrobiales bacterium]
MRVTTRTKVVLRRPFVALGVAAVVCLGATVSVEAAETRQQKKDRQATIAAQLRTLREEVSEASQEEALLLDRLDEVKARRRQLDNRVAALDRQLLVVSAEAGTAEARLAEMQGDFVRTQTQLAIASGRLAVERGVLRDRAVSAYMGGRPASTPTEVILNARSLREVAATIGYQDAVVHAQRRAVDRFSAGRDATVRLREVLEVKKDAAKAQRDVVIGRQAELEGLRAEQNSVRQDVRAQELQQQSLAAEAQARVAEFEAQIAALRAESGTITAFLRGLQAGQGRVTGGQGILSPPLPGGRLTSPFGPRYHPVLGTARMHDGVDFAAPSGAPIRAAAGGTVVFAGPRGGYGNTVIVDHGNSLATLYAHQSQVHVAEGTPVTAGQLIGEVGSTGLSTGPHLHFETRVAGAPVNPLLYL